jgi:ElaB/YqjD/DUF883 family membrane-anchored ribosome-binding protein
LETNGMATRSEVHERVVFAATPNPQGIRVVWGSIWSGFLVALGAFVLLTVLGLAIGISAADIGSPEDSSAAGWGISAAVWSGLTLLIALFIGGWVATRAGMVYDEATGLIEGVLVWVLSILALLYLAGSGIGLLSNSIFGTLGNVTQGAVAAVRNIDVAALSSGDAGQISARLNDPVTTQFVAVATGLSEADARWTLDDIARRVQAARADPDQAAAEARKGLQSLAAKASARAQQAAAKAQPYASATMWTALVAMVSGLLAAIGGAMTGRRNVIFRLGHAMTGKTAYRW